MAKFIVVAENVGVNIHYVRELFKGRITYNAILNRLKKWGKENLSDPRQGALIKAYTYYESGKYSYTTTRGSPAINIYKLLSRLPNPYLEYGNDAPRGGKLGDYVVFEYKDMMMNLECYINASKYLKDFIK